MPRHFLVDDVPANVIPAKTVEKLRASFLVDWNAEHDAPVTDARRLRITCQKYEPGGRHLPHQHSDLEQAYYIVKGIAHIRIGRDEFEVGPGAMVYLPPNVEHELVNIGGGELVHLLINVSLAPKGPGE